MIRHALLVVLFFVGLSSFALAQESQQHFKSISDCDKTWNAWADTAMPHYQTLSHDYEALKADYGRLEEQNETLRSSAQNAWETRTEVNLVLAAIGIGTGVVCAFWLARALKRLWPVSNKGKQLVFLACGAAWITVVAVIAVNDSDLSRHLVNMLFTVLVYSLPALLFGGIGFWWFGKAKQQEPTP